MIPFLYLSLSLHSLSHCHFWSFSLLLLLPYRYHNHVEELRRVISMRMLQMSWKACKYDRRDRTTFSPSTPYLKKRNNLVSSTSRLALSLALIHSLAHSPWSYGAWMFLKRSWGPYQISSATLARTSSQLLPMSTVGLGLFCWLRKGKGRQ